MKGLGIIKWLDLGLVEALSKLAPHGIEHHFGQGAQTRVVFDLVVLQPDAFVLLVLAKVLLTFGFVVPDPRRPPAGFLLDFQPGVDVVSEESLTGLVKMPDLIDVLDLVPQRHRFVQFGTTPGPGEDALLVGVDAFGRSLPWAFGHFFFHTRRTQRKGEFVLMAVRQHGMVQGTWRQNTTLDETKVEVDVGVTRLGNEARMSFGVHTGFVDPRVQGGDIDVMDLLAGGHMMVEFDGIGTTSTEGVAGMERFREGQVLDERSDIWRGVFEAVPFAPPHFHDLVPSRSKRLEFLLGGLVHILHGPIIVAHMFLVTVRITAGTSVGEATLKFVHGVRGDIEAVHEPHGWDVNLAGITYMLHVLAMTGMRMVTVRAGHQIMLFQVVGAQLFEGVLALLVIAPG